MASDFTVPDMADVSRLLPPALTAAAIPLQAFFCLLALLALFFWWSRARQARHWHRLLQEEVKQHSVPLDERIELLGKHNRDLEMALTDRNHRLGEVMEGIPGEVFWVSRELRYVRVNSQTARARGLYPRDFEGRPVGFTGGEYAPRLRAALLEFFERPGVSAQFELPPEQSTDGKTRYVSLRRFRDGGDALVVSQSINVLDAPSPAATGFPDQRNTSSERLASLGEMVAGIAHEINNPLAIINGRVQVLRTKAVSGMLSSEDLLSSLDKLSQTVFRISKIILGLRSFVRPGVGESPEDLAPARAVEDALDFCKGRFHKQNVRILVDVSSRRLVHCVPVQLSQILLNLLNNSLHAVGGRTDAWVRIEARDEGEWVEFRVSDSGPGVSADIAERIFEPFFTTKDRTRGTGLGLSISRGLAESNGGLLRLLTEFPPTTFILSLPARSGSDAAATVVSKELEPDE